VRGRVDQLESNLTQVLSILAQKNTAKDEPQSATTYMPTPSNTSPSVGLRYDDDILHDLELGLPLYRRFSTFWPYVMVPEETTASELLRLRPLLASAIVLVTSWTEPEKQAMQKTAFLKDLGERFFGFDRSLDLLQALLVYFGW
jgi:hypothetical protein